MTLRQNLAAGYVSQILTTLLGIATVPVLIYLLGIESYGLVGLFVTLQGWFSLLDAGFSPALARESSRLSAGAVSRKQYDAIYLIIARFFFSAGIIIFAVVLVVSQTFAAQWVSSSTLPSETVSLAIALMAPSLGLRFISSFYRAVLSGFERLAWLSMITIAISLSRFVLIVPILFFFKGNISVYFFYQFVVSIIELTIIRNKAKSIIPIDIIEHEKLADPNLREILKFSTGFGIATIAWVFVSQSDRLILSGILTLKDYGTFTVITLAASAVMLIASPTGSAIIPRLTNLYARNDRDEASALYHISARYVAAGTAIIGSALIFYSSDVLMAWTGRSEIATQGSVLAFYAAGNMVLTITSFPMFLQSAIGNVSLHLRGQLVFAFIIVPFIALSAISFGMLGAAVTWFLGNLTYFLLYVALVHKRYLPGQHGNWLLNVVGATIPALTSSLILRMVLPPSGSRITALLNIGFGLAMAAGMSLMLLPWLRTGLLNFVLGEGKRDG